MNEALCLDACNSPGCLMKKMLSGAQRSNYLMELQTKETGKRNIVISSQAIYDESKQLSGIIECFTDITELQWAEQELLSKGKEITKKNAELQAQNAELQKVELEQKSIIQRLEKAEVMLKESNDRYQLLSEVTFEGILIHHNGIAIDANNRFFNMTGFDRSDIPGLDVFDIVSTLSLSTI
jgi:transcriptional regulator with PAS, ATPase and Fis domain